MNAGKAADKLTDDVAQRVVDALERPRWSSPDPTLWAMLSNSRAASNRLIVRWGMIVAVVTYVSYGLFDYFLFPDVAHKLILTRITLGLIFIIMLESAIRFSTSINNLHFIAASAIVTGSIGWLAVAIETEYHTSLSYFILFGIIFILGANLFFNFRFWISALSSTIIAVTFIVATLAVLELELYVRIVVAALFANCLLSSLYLSWRLGIERYRTFLHALRAQIQEQAAVESGQKLVEMANTDPLTGLRNRRAIEREFLEMQNEWSESDDEIGLILIDVDYFKRYNDRFGHHAGDECLITLTQALAETASLRGAIVGRYGGEEFIVLCKVEGKDELSSFAQMFCSRVEDLELVHPDRDDELGIVTISAGATITQTEKIKDLDVLLQEADRALYVSKFAGRARSTVFEPGAVENDPSSDNLSRLLRTAIENNLVSVVYQPILEAETEVVIGHEALMRLTDHDGSNISPTVFVPVAERDGVIVDLGLWVIDRACRDMADRKLGSIVSVNVSAVQLRAPNFALRLTEILNRHQLACAQVVIEITESTDIIPEAQAVRSIEQIRGLGVQVWLDDFGTGYAGLEWLRRVTFDTVKIDRSFLHDCQTLKGLRMLQDMVRLLRNRGHTVLVEGVETEEQKLLLQRLGVDLMQGFYIGIPQGVERLDNGEWSRVSVNA